MSTKRIVGLIPIFCLVSLGIGYSLIQIIGSQEGRRELVNSITNGDQPSGNKLPKVEMTPGGLDEAIQHFEELGRLQKGTVLSQWKITSDTTAQIVSGVDTILLKSTQRTLRHPHGIAIL